MKEVLTQSPLSSFHRTGRWCCGRKRHQYLYQECYSANLPGKMFSLVQQWYNYGGGMVSNHILVLGKKHISGTVNLGKSPWLRRSQARVSSTTAVTLNSHVTKCSQFRLITRYSTEPKWLLSTYSDGTPTPHPPQDSQGTAQKTGWEEWKRQRVGRDAVKGCPLAVKRLEHSWTHSSNGCLDKIKLISILAQNKKEFINPQPWLRS